MQVDVIELLLALVSLSRYLLDRLLFQGGFARPLIFLMPLIAPVLRRHTGSVLLLEIMEIVIVEVFRMAFWVHLESLFKSRRHFWFVIVIIAELRLLLLWVRFVLYFFHWYTEVLDLGVIVM